MAGFPAQRDDLIYLSEGGQETEIMYRHGHDLPEFAMYPLLEDPKAMADLRGMYERYFETAARHGFGALVGGLDYRASPDWGTKLGYSASALADAELASIGFLREVAAPYAPDLPALLFVGIIGPRGDAYQLNKTITAEEAEEYHSVQLSTLAAAGVDMAHAMTFNSTAEAAGVARAAHAVGMPLAVSFTLDSNGRLHSGPSLAEAVTSVDASTGDARPDFYGLNCSHPVEMEKALQPGAWSQRLRVFRPNAVLMEKVALCQLGHLEDGDPPELGRQMGDLARRFPQVDIWGGCCGTWDAHLGEIAANVAAVRSA